MTMSYHGRVQRESAVCRQRMPARPARGRAAQCTRYDQQLTVLTVQGPVPTCHITMGHRKRAGSKATGGQKRGQAWPPRQWACPSP